MNNHGELRERNYRRRRLLILGLSALLSGLAPFVVKIAGDENVMFPAEVFGHGWHLPIAIRICVGVLFIGTLSLGARWNWVSSDEVGRSHIQSFWAAIGVSVGLTFFGYMLFGREIPEVARLPLAFFLPIVMGLVFAIARWFRDGFVW